MPTADYVVMYKWVGKVGRSFSPLTTEPLPFGLVLMLRFANTSWLELC